MSATPPSDPVAGRSVALFLDFDGTLAEIAPHPDAVSIDSLLLDALERLRDQLGGALAIVSGRSVPRLDHLLAPHAFDVAGLHGAMLRVGGRPFGSEAPRTDRLRYVVARLNDVVGVVPGLLVEDKGHSVAVHWRQAPALAGFAMGQIREALAELDDGYRIQRGKSVAEIVPRHASKRRAIETLMTHPTYAGRTPLFIGDDLTDEAGFEAVNAIDGISVKVGAEPTLAAWRLSSPQAVRTSLLHWAETGRIDFDGIVHA